MSDVRRLFKKQKQARSTQVNHPFAKYDQGRLICIVCNSQVKNENVWQGHLGSSHHRQNIEKLKSLKQQQQQQQKRPAPKSDQDQDPKRAKLVESSEEEEEEEEGEEENGLPADFFDNEPMEEDMVEEEEIANEKADSKTIPAGFFDDPEEEAKAQRLANEQAKLDMEKDLSDFHEKMIEVSTETRELEDEDDETLYANRNQDIFEEQVLLDARVEKLKQMRQAKTAKSESNVRHLFTKKQVETTPSMFDDESSEEE
ncbi:hypothetical protein G6F56_001413 [Rhizopus delemar]|nr:hypothetical protein G6F56_001413 [Rhizopus delemar]